MTSEEEEEEEDLYQTEKDPYETYLLLLSVLLIIFVCIYIFKRSTSKMREIAGEKIDIDEEPKESKIKKENKKTKLNKIKNTIKTLDATYTKTRNGFANSEYTATAPVQMEEIPEIANVVDLDEIFQETKNKTTEISPKEYEENLALEEFLRGFSFIEDEPEEPIEESVGYDEEFYNKVMSNNRLKFTDVDIECINKLLNTEINDLTLKNIKNYAVSNPIKKVPTKEQILEDLVTTYTISQNISFSKDDIGALYKLISVEIDHDFITDLKTNPERTKEMYRELQSQPEKTKKTSEIITLNVKDFLPDLSEELRKQGNRQIEPEIKPITVFYSEGYEVSKLAINDVLPDLSAELHKKDAYVSKPSAEYQIVDNSYEVEKMHIDYDLPDLEDVVANPQKYAEPEPEEIYVDEDALLNNISNVRFKPFYDGSESFEILNDLEEVNLIKQRELEELKASFLDLDAIKKDISIPESITNKTESIENKEEIIKPKTIIEPNIIESEIKDKNPETINQTKPTSLLTQKNEKSINKELQKKIEQRREERIRQRSILAFSDKRSTTKEQVVNKQDIKCILEGKTYSVTSSVDFGNNMGCHLAKSEEGYSVLGYIGDNLIRLKNYTNLKSEKIQARVSEKLENGLLRYIVRIGLNKFILDVSPEKIQYVMDLC